MPWRQENHELPRAQQKGSEPFDAFLLQPRHGKISRIVESCVVTTTQREKSYFKKTTLSRTTEVCRCARWMWRLLYNIGCFLLVVVVVVVAVAVGVVALASSE